MKKNTVILLIVGLLVIGGAAFAIAGSGTEKAAEDIGSEERTGITDTSDDEASQDEGAGAGLTDSGDDEETAVSATITYGNGGFSPTEITVKAGDTIRVSNISSQPLDFASDPHPIHDDDPELNAGSIDPGTSKTFIVKNKGTWGFHNHENEDHEGTLVVQ